MNVGKENKTVNRNILENFQREAKGVKIYRMTKIRIISVMQ
jgi:hypothetical protein